MPFGPTVQKPKGPTAAEGKNDWTSEFAAEKSELASTGRNPYFNLEPGYRLFTKMAKVQLVITVLDQTKTIDGG